jgi:hypothetical protein
LQRSKGICILLISGNQIKSGASEKRSKMGLFKRGQVWWLSFTYRGKSYRKSTETTERKLAQKILTKVKYEVAQGKWFETAQGETRTFHEMMDRYLEEHVSKKKSQRAYRGYVHNL